jgi:hypothetical protein
MTEAQRKDDAARAVEALKRGRIAPRIERRIVQLISCNTEGVRLARLRCDVIELRQIIAWAIVRETIGEAKGSTAVEPVFLSDGVPQVADTQYDSDELVLERGEKAVLTDAGYLDVEADDEP